MTGNRFVYHLILTVILFGLLSCSSTKKLPEGEVLYTGATIKIEDSLHSSKKKKHLKKELKGFTRPKPNSRILGIPFKLLLYNLAGNPKKKRSPAAWLKKMGEPPVLLSNVSVRRNSDILKNQLENTGYLQAAVSGDTVVKNRKGQAVYTAKPGAQYTINEVVFETDSLRLQQKILEISSKSLLKQGDPFNLEVIRGERQRIDAHLKENGYYFFHSEHLLIDVDSTIGSNRVNLYVRVKPNTPADAKKVYSINDVYIYSNYSLNTAAADTNKTHAIYYRGYYLVDKDDRYKPKLFEQAMQFSPGDIYNRTDHNLTLSRLMTLGIFKFVKNRFEVASYSKDTALDAFYYLTPFPKQSLRAEIGGNTKSNNMTGSEVSLIYTNRNTFRAGEIFNLKASAGSEIQYSGQFKGYNTFRIGAEGNFAIPRFVTPFFKINTKGGYVPKTNIQLGYDILNRQKLYTLNSFRGGLGYLWKESIRKEHQFYPISIQYVQPVNVTQIYIDSAKSNRLLQKAIDTQFILGANYNYIYNQLVGHRTMEGIYFHGLVDVSGNIVGLIAGANANKGKTKNIFGAPFSQYIKTETDFRYYFKLSEGNVLANRIIVGLGFPYGNSRQLPFIKQFFIGGNNSIRAFRSRSVGPGSYRPPDRHSVGFLPDQSGDLKLELNTELRIKLTRILYGAVFVDAGNIWLAKEDTTQPGGKFSKDFLSELAVGTGVGIRIDITFFVLRFDVAFPLREPPLPKGERWVIDQIKFGNKGWRRENVIFNIAIGYPF